MPKDIYDPAVIRFLNESYDKETLLRIRWFFVNKARLEDAAGIGRELKNITKEEVESISILSGIDALAVAHRESVVNRLQKPFTDAKDIMGVEKLKKTHTLKELGLATEDDPHADQPITDLGIHHIMRPVNDDDMNILYLPKPEHGRLEYLRKRATIKPEDKYYFAETTTFDYGWRTKDSLMPKIQAKAGRFGHYSLLTRHGQSRSGPHPDPAHYRYPATTPNFCACIP